MQICRQGGECRQLNLSIVIDVANARMADLKISAAMTRGFKKVPEYHTWNGFSPFLFLVVSDQNRMDPCEAKVVIEG